MNIQRKPEVSHVITLAHDIFIHWKPEYELGIPILDEQHRGIVSTINSLYYGMQHNYVADVLAPIIDMMHDYAKVHFHMEEDFMEKIGFPHLDAHRKMHSVLTAKLADIGRGSMMSHDPQVLLEFLKKWWLDHIGICDMQYKPYGVRAAI